MPVVDLIVDALMAIGRSDRATAVSLVDQASAAYPDALLPGELGRYLRSAASGEVYVDPLGFEQFIGGGNNPELYRLTIAILADRHAVNRPASAVDLGCGDGRVTASVFADGIHQVDLVEPSDALLSSAVTAVRSALGSSGQAEVQGHNTTATSFFAGLDARRRWDSVQSTFAMHTLLPVDRASVLRSIASHADRFLMVDFDVPDFADRSVDHARYAAERYEVGLHEYPGNDVVSQCFLMPVLVGQFDPTQTRHTFEQPADEWTRLASEAGFTDVRITPVFDYWWAPAFLLEATVS